eukprot:302846_1
MAHTARSKEEEREFFDNAEELDRKVTKLANMIKQAKHFTVFTGAGISTSAGIPDFRSGLNTVLPTGVGAWAKRAAIQKGIDVTPKKKLKIKSTLNAIPTPTHMALVELNKQNILKYLMSQNCDGLHRRSGYDPNTISELHGNTNLEFCKACGKQYLRDFRVRKRGNSVHNHKTARKCTVKGCGQPLYDTIINFGECLNDWAWDPAEDHAGESDCCLALGSSLSVTPAADLPQSIALKAKSTFCIINLQKTNMDDLCDVRIFAKCDEVMTALLGKLGLQVPPWRLQRYIQVNVNEVEHVISVSGIDSDGTPYDILSLIKLVVKNDKEYEKSGKCLAGARFKMPTKSGLKQNKMCLELGFMGHYNEPNLMIDLNKYWTNNADEFVLNLSYDPYQGTWDVRKMGGESGGDEKEDEAGEDQKNDVNDEEEVKQEEQVEGEEIYVGNTHQIASADKKNAHIWTMFVSTNKNKLVKSEGIKEVKYELHPTFSPSQVIVTEAPFVLKRKGWGTFTVDVTIVFKDSVKRDDVVCGHELNFDYPVTITQVGKDPKVKNDVVHFGKDYSKTHPCENAFRMS